MGEYIFNYMVEYTKEQKLSDTLRAVSDETRRSLLLVLCQQGPCRVTDLATHYDMSLNRISMHLKILEKAGLVRRQTRGREHWIQAEPDSVDSIREWIDQLKSIWETSLEQLENKIGEDK